MKSGRGEGFGSRRFIGVEKVGLVVLKRRLVGVLRNLFIYLFLIYNNNNNNNL